MSLPREAENRKLVALACRVMAVAGLFDMHGHISLRDGDVAYINGRRTSRVSVTAAEVAIVKVADGAIVSGEPPAETPLHLGCYRARPEIRSASHFHPLAATAFATVGKPLITAFNAGAPFGKAVPVYDDPDLVRNDDQGSAERAWCRSETSEWRRPATVPAHASTTSSSPTRCRRRCKAWKMPISRWEIC